MAVLVLYTTEGMNGSEFVASSQAGVFSKHENLRHRILTFWRLTSTIVDVPHR